MISVIHIGERKKGQSTTAPIIRQPSQLTHIPSGLSLTLESITVSILSQLFYCSGGVKQKVPDMNSDLSISLGLGSNLEQVCIKMKSQEDVEVVEGLVSVIS
ncbi:hypothetical protein FOYG_08693 [Fusarium oxysporum NRRL 32931]|uniref:Uncharacterized protein n=1 Tax=Fusarium oxysporum NRRL 32931 TaxID=660029 RepID=W9IED2_FUSOX|nr:hypothetical protein FOYG_08693 [Fusarium oxysporum NRRL 32931]